MTPVLESVSKKELKLYFKLTVSPKSGLTVAIQRHLPTVIPATLPLTGSISVVQIKVQNPICFCRASACTPRQLCRPTCPTRTFLLFLQPHFVPYPG